jgi:hypothetical protein
MLVVVMVGCGDKTVALMEKKFNFASPELAAP